MICELFRYEILDVRFLLFNFELIGYGKEKRIR